MSSKDIEIDGRPLSSLRVVDLKDELQKRGLSKSGAKKELELRLRKHLQNEQARVSIANTVDDEELPNISMRNEHEENPFIKEYLASQAELFHSQKVIKKQFDEEQKRESEASADESTTNKMGQEVESPVRSESSESPTHRPRAPVLIPPVLQSPPPSTVKIQPPQLQVEKEIESPPAKRELRTRGRAPAAPEPPTVPELSPRRSSRDKKEEAVEVSPSTSLTEVIVEKRRRLSSRGAASATDDSPLKEVIVETPRIRKLSARNVEAEKETIPTAQMSKISPEKAKFQESPTKKVVDPVVVLPPSPSPSPPSTVPAVEIPQKVTEVKKTPDVEIKKSPEKVKVVESPIKKTEVVVEELKKSPEKVQVVESPIKKTPEKVVEEIKKAPEKAKVVESPIKKAPEVVEGFKKSPEKVQVVESPIKKAPEVAEGLKKSPEKVQVVESPIKKAPEVVVEELKKSPEKILQKVAEKTPEISPEREKVAVVSPIKRVPAVPVLATITKPIVDEKDKEKESSSSSSTSSGSSTSDGDSEPEDQVPEKEIKKPIVEVKKSTIVPIIVEKMKEKETPAPTKPKLALPSDRDDEIDLHPDEMELSSFDTPPKKEKEKEKVIVKEREKEKEREKVIVEHKKIITKAPEPPPKPPPVIKKAKSPPPSKPKLTQEPQKTTTSVPVPVPAPVSKRPSQTIESMDQETLDYGDLEEEVVKPKEKYSWTRRVLNLKNIMKKSEKSKSADTATADSKEKKAVEVESKTSSTITIQRVNTDSLNKHYADLNLVPEKELDILPSSNAEASNKSAGEEDADEEGKIKKRRISIQSENATSTEFNGFNRTIVNDLPTASTSTTTKSTNLKRQISMVPLGTETDEISKVPTNLVLITNLVRPFTLPQLKELLGRTGDLQDVWLDKIKSKCIAKYATSEEAFETRAALHGIKWPSSNFKELAVDYSTEEVLEKCKNDLQFSSSRTITVEKFDTQDIIKEPDASGQTREWDMGKKRSRSRSPNKTTKRARRSRSNERAEPPQQQGKALDELFKKTNALPQIYWLPLTPKQIEEKEEMRRKRLEEREIRLKEIREMHQIPSSRPLMRFR